MPGVDMPDQSRLANTIDICTDAQIRCAVNVDQVERDKDGGILPEFDPAKCNVLALFFLWLGDGTHIHRVDGCAKGVCTILWVGDPARLYGVHDRVSPGVDMDCESIHVNVACVHVEAPVTILVEVDVVEKDDDLGGG